MKKRGGQLGNKGGGRKSAYEELVDATWQHKLWEIDQMVLELQQKIQSRKYSARDMFALKCLTGEERMLKTLADKMLPDRAPEDGDGKTIPMLIIDRTNGGKSTDTSNRD